jgi:hypothetical protein
MRQSAKRGMLNQTPADPDQPGAAMAASMSKNMMYIAPLFALSGLYWQFGLVIYWVTTNVWTLCQQHILFRNLPVVGSTTVDASAVGAASGNTGAAVKNSGTGTSSAVRARAAASKASATKAKTSSAPAGTAPAAKAPAAAKTAATKTSGAKAPAASTTAAKAKAPAAKAPAAKAPAANATAAKAPSSKAAANGSVQDDVPSTADANGSDANGSGRGLLRFGRGKQEPEPVPAAPQTKVVRQQPVRQSRSKRGNTGKR